MLQSLAILAFVVILAFGIYLVAAQFIKLYNEPPPEQTRKPKKGRKAGRYWRLGRRTR